MARIAGMLATAFAFLAIPFVYCRSRCPYDNCKCDDDKATCWNVSSMEEMEKIMKSISDKSIKASKFYLSNTLLPALPEDLFAGTELKKLDFENVELPFIVPPIKKLSPFTGLEKLEEIHFKKVSYMYNWNWTMFTNLNDLFNFVAKDSIFIYVTKRFSDMKSHLKHLHLTNCKIRWIDNGAFSTFSEMSNLILVDNYISSFPRSILPTPALKLVKIDLRNNKLVALESNLFSDMPELKYVSVINNHLQTLSEKLFSHVKRGFTFYVEDNPFICDCDLFWICKPSTVRYLVVDYGKTTCSDPSDLSLKRMCENKKKEKCP